MRQHRAGDDVADCVNAGDVGAEHFVHFDPALFVESDADFVRPNPFGEGAAADGDENLVRLKIEFLAAFRGGRRRRGPSSTLTEPTLVSR